ncbi:hypothetical protein MKW98_003104 [Papaver atlanticum]|uniref:Uncharacterized protein n=1 Tax=Papaver atlanticum TaxID=357466 RepID=A0AAD4TEQ3_9MAGN|nr:hypothetical protein MKW98_003104 [Papaver atlanticum]
MVLLLELQVQDNLLGHKLCVDSAVSSIFLRLRSIYKEPAVEREYKHHCLTFLELHKIVLGLRGRRTHKTSCDREEEPSGQ